MRVSLYLRHNLLTDDILCLCPRHLVLWQNRPISTNVIKYILLGIDILTKACCSSIVAVNMTEMRTRMKEFNHRGRVRKIFKTQIVMLDILTSNNKI